MAVAALLLVWGCIPEVLRRGGGAKLPYQGPQCQESPSATFQNIDCLHCGASIVTPTMFGPFRLTNPLSGGLLWYAVRLFLCRPVTASCGRLAPELPPCTHTIETPLRQMLTWS